MTVRERVEQLLKEMGWIADQEASEVIIHCEYPDKSSSTDISGGKDA